MCKVIKWADNWVPGQQFFPTAMLVLHSQPLTPAGEGLVTSNTQSWYVKLAILRDVMLQFILRSARLPIINDVTVFMPRSN